ncbi:MAG: ATP synthase F1 subunit delta [Planctomycetota bacterium]
MPKFDEEQLALAKVYSAAMLALAQETGAAQTLAEELVQIGKLLDREKGLESYFVSPAVDAETRKLTIEKWFRGRASDLLVDSLQILNQNERLGLVGALVEAYRLQMEESLGVVDAHVRTAAPLSEAMQVRLRELVKRRTGKKAELIVTVDPELIGGLVVQVGDEKLDASVATKLGRVGAILLDRASREIHSGRSYVDERAA